MREDSRRALLGEMAKTILESPGAIDPQVRAAAAQGRDVPAALAPFVNNVANSAWKITDADLAALTAGGFSEDQVYEVAVAAAVGAGMKRLDAALAALDKAGPA